MGRIVSRKGSNNKRVSIPGKEEIAYRENFIIIESKSGEAKNSKKEISERKRTDILSI